MIVNVQIGTLIENLNSIQSFRDMCHTGFDSGADLRLTGAAAARPIWIEFARQIVPSDSPDFEVPVGIVRRKVDPQTGQLATSGCPEAVEEVFIEGTEPTDYCAIHGGGLWEGRETQRRRGRAVLGARSHDLLSSRND